MKNKIVAANFKMNLSKQEIKDYLQEVEGHIPKEKVVFFPSSIYANLFLEKNYQVGIQNVYSKEKGPYTGEISPSSAFSVGISYVLLGHSERRYIFHESDEGIAEKVKESLKQNLKVILCIGETEEEKRNGKVEVKLKKQIESAFYEISSLEAIWIAYEPVWSIGTGKTPEKEEIEKVFSLIRKIINDLGYQEHIPILYGGSVDLENIKYLKEIKGVDGFLVGSAAINPRTFLKIVEVAVTM